MIAERQAKSPVLSRERGPGAALAAAVAVGFDADAVTVTGDVVPVLS